MHPNEIKLTTLTEQEREVILSGVSPAHKAAFEEQLRRQTEK
jgi:hypothetical protein